MDTLQIKDEALTYEYYKNLTKDVCLSVCAQLIKLSDQAKPQVVMTGFLLTSTVCACSEPLLRKSPLRNYQKYFVS